MSPLRQKMIDAMRQRGFSIRTHQSYIEAVKKFSRFHPHPIAQATDDDVARYFEHLVRERNLRPLDVSRSLGSVEVSVRKSI